METTRLNITVENDGMGQVPPELIFREGKAPEVFNPEIVSLSGTIEAPADFADKRKGTYKPENANVVAHYRNRTIRLRIDERDRFGATILGTLALHPDLQALRINENRKYNHRELYELLKFKGIYFKDSVAHSTMLEKLKKFEATVHKEFASQDDFKGTAAYNKLVGIKTNLDLEFVLSVPIFAGQRPEEFRVDICVDSEAGAPIFWLESLQLHDAVIAGTEEIFETQLDRLAHFVIIKQFA